jgi:hypothetical protein
MACYKGRNPVTDEERWHIWDWVKANAIDRGVPIEKAAEMVNKKFFSGRAPETWIADIMSGRKTPYKNLADKLWAAQYKRRVLTDRALNLSRKESLGPLFPYFNAILAAPRSLTTFGHGTVFPLTHAGDLAARPGSWHIWVPGTLRTWENMWSPTRTTQILAAMQRDPLFSLGLSNGLDAGPHSFATGILGTYFTGPSKRAWDLLTVMRFELWKSQIKKFADSDISPEELADHAKKLADWANHATGSAGFMPESWGKRAEISGSQIAAAAAFGPRLTASKIARLFVDPANTALTLAKQTADIFRKEKKATAAEKNVAWLRVRGAAQYAGTLIAFLMINDAVNKALKTGSNVNFTDPSKSDWMQFKLGGLKIGIPGLHSELRFLAQLLAVRWMDRKQMYGAGKQERQSNLLGGYIAGKESPGIGLGREVWTGENWMGRPVPWSNSPGTPKRPRMSWAEFGAEHSPIFLEGPAGYVYDHFKKQGATPKEAMNWTKALIWTGLGFMGFEVREEKPEPTPKK